MLVTRNPNCKHKGWNPSVPKLYSPKIVNRILKLILEGRTIKNITDRRGMPCRSTMMVWLIKYPEFRRQYYEAKQLQAQVNVDRIVEVALSADAKSPASVMRAKLLVDTMKWEAGKMLPRVYGERATIDLTQKQEITTGQLEEILAKAFTRVTANPTPMVIEHHPITPTRNVPKNITASSSSAPPPRPSARKIPSSSSLFGKPPQPQPPGAGSSLFGGDE